MRVGAKGSDKKARISPMFRSIASLLLPRVARPTTVAHMVAGRKSNPKKTGGAPTKNPMIVPKATAKGPTKGPRMIPYSGATISPALKLAPGIANMGNVGTALKTA